MATFPRDQFDAIPDDLTRVGAHRAPAKKGRGWLAFLWAVLATVALVAGGLFTLSRLDSKFAIDFPIFAADQIEDADWPDPARANASERDREETIVYYNGEQYEGVARGIALLLGVEKVELSEAFPGAIITVVLGTDYIPPAE
jgi:hypothetical protein